MKTRLKFPRISTAVVISRCVISICSLAALCSLAAQNANQIASVDTQLLTEVHDHNQLMSNAEHLSDAIGPRLTGSPQQRTASDWAAQLFRQYGLVNVHQETWTVAHAWTRGSAEASITAPVSRRVPIASAGWSPSTDGKVEGPVVYVSAKSPSDLDRYKSKLAGAIVILDEPDSVTLPNDMGHPAMQFDLQAPYKEPQGPEPESFHSIERRFLKAEGVRVVLRDSGKPYNLLSMSNGSEGDYQPGLIPTGMISHEDYALLWRLLKRGEVHMQVSFTNTFGPSPVETSNTVAEIRGSEKPDEVVMLAAHIDSWDLASGSTDNGTGTVVVLEAARALARLNPAPKRTVRFVLFSGEEEGEIGSHLYVTQHQEELPKISGVLIDDTGTGPIVTIGTHENYPDIGAITEILAPVSERLHLFEPKISRTFGSDYAAFNEVGVPGFSCIGDSPNYYLTHHSQADTFDKISEAGVVESAQFMAVWAFNTAEYPTLLPRKTAK
jgi:carboxypeptidase Q